MSFFHVVHRTFNHVEKAVMLSDLCLKVKNSHLHQQKLLRFYSSAWETEFFHSIIIFIVILVDRVILFLSVIHFSNLKSKRVKHNFDFPFALFSILSFIFVRWWRLHFTCSDDEACSGDLSGLTRSSRGNRRDMPFIEKCTSATKKVKCSYD